MNIEIPTMDERIANKYSGDISLLVETLNKAIANDDFQSNWKGHQWVSIRFVEPVKHLPDELFDFLHETYQKAGWYLERWYGEEDTDEGKLLGINCFVSNKKGT